MKISQMISVHVSLIEFFILLVDFTCDDQSVQVGIEDCFGCKERAEGENLDLRCETDAVHWHAAQ